MDDIILYNGKIYPMSRVGECFSTMPQAARLMLELPARG